MSEASNINNSSADNLDAVRHDAPHLDHLSLSELENLLEEAEQGIQSIRLEMRERRAEIEAGMKDESIDSMLPHSNLEEARGHWSQFFSFLRDAMGSRKKDSDAGSIDLTDSAQVSTDK